MDSSSLEQTSEFYSPLKVNKISELCVFLTLRSEQNIHTQCLFNFKSKQNLYSNLVFIPLRSKLNIQFLCFLHPKK